MKEPQVIMLFKCYCFVSVLVVLCSGLGLSQSPQQRPAGVDGSKQITAAIRDRWFTTSDNVKIHFRSAGEMKSAPAIVFIPGWTLTASLWDQKLRTFSATRLALAVDSRSQGESTMALSGNTPERRATDLHELITNLHISMFVLVGWSQGAQDVAAYIQQFGTDSVAGVVFVDSPVSYGPV